MAGTRSAQEVNLLNGVNAFIKACGGGPITIKFTNSYLGQGLLADVMSFDENLNGDRSPVDIIARTSTTSYKISCKQDNPISFCGSGLKSFSKELMMRKFLNRALGRAAGTLKAILEPYKKPIEDMVIAHTRQYGGQAFTASEKKQFDILVSKLNNVQLPDLYIKLPKSMRSALLSGQGELDAPITHYITGGIANPAMMKKDIKTKTLEITDCEVHTIQEMVDDGGINLFLVIRKRRADQALEIVDSKLPGSPPIKDTKGFLNVYGRSKGNPHEFGRRLQIRERSQLPKALRTSLFEDNDGVTPIKRAPANSQIIEVEWP